MMDYDISWIYLLLFLIIPLTRIVPRLAARWRRKTVDSNRDLTDVSGVEQTDRKAPRIRTLPMQVLEELVGGCRTFEALQKNTNMNADDLDRVLVELERDGLMHARQKRGLLGTKIELYPTDVGYKRFHS